MWDCSKIGATQTAEQKKAGAPEILFQHAGHRSEIVDFHWNPYDPWTIASSSIGDAGNTMQIWRMNDLIYKPEEEALAELERHRDVICGRNKAGSHAAMDTDDGALHDEGANHHTFDGMETEGGAGGAFVVE